MIHRMFYRLEAPPISSWELRRIDLNARLTEDSIKRISAALCHNERVTSLTLNNAKIAASNIGHIASMLTQNDTLEVLFLRNNNIDAKAAAILSNGLAKNKTLHTLNLGIDVIDMPCVQTCVSNRCNAVSQKSNACLDACLNTCLSTCLSYVLTQRTISYATMVRGPWAISSCRRAKARQ